MNLDQADAVFGCSPLSQGPQVNCGAKTSQFWAVAPTPEPAFAPTARRKASIAQAERLHGSPKWRAFARSVSKDLTVNLTHMNKALLWRRMLQRMRIAHHDKLDAYVRHLRHDAAERDALRRALCAGFTSFFRDADTFDQMQRQHAAALWQRNRPLRIWVPGCSTGQEAYSWAMCLLDGRPPPCQQRLTIIATDIDGTALNIACKGYYTHDEVVGVGAARLDRYFTRDAHGYRIKHAVRSMISFRRHDVLERNNIGPMDVISCRNLLTAMTHAAQRRITRRCAAALADGGLLLVGSTEDIGGATRWFEAVDRARRIYKRRSPMPRRGQKRRSLGSAVTHLDLAQQVVASNTRALCALELSGGLRAPPQGVQVP